MDQRDRMVALLGIMVVVFSGGLGTAFATGLIDIDDGTGGNYLADWSMTRTVSTSEVGLNGQTISFDVPEHNMTSLVVRLSWTDDELVSVIGRRADILTIEVEGPSTLDMDPQTSTGTSGELVVQFDIASVPIDDDPTNIGEYDDANASGEWQVMVTVNAQGLRDTGNDWTVTFSYSYYLGRLVEAPEAN